MSTNKIDTSPDTPWNDDAEGKEISRSRTLIGQPPSNHWIHDDDHPTFDLTRPPGPAFPTPDSKDSILIKTTTTPIILSPSKTALVIIDMQNFFLSPVLGRQADGPGNQARRQLLENALPAANDGEIQVIWLNWGLNQDDLNGMPASTLRAFGFRTSRSAKDSKDGLNELGKPRKLYHGLGSDMGPVQLEDGTTVDAGRLLMRETWNADLPPDLKETYQSSQTSNLPHAWIHKNRMSGLWGGSTPCTQFLQERGISTLLFAGVNSDQCVAGSLQDAYTKGFDCILLSDACGTTSPEYAKQCVEFNAQRSWGFVADCKAFKDGVSDMIKARNRRL